MRRKDILNRNRGFMWCVIVPALFVIVVVAAIMLWCAGAAAM